MSRLWPRAVLLASLLALTGGGASSAAPPQNLGQNPISTEGGCTLCSVVQLSNSATPNTYVFPGDGVLTRARFYVGPFTEAPDYAQARVFRKTGGTGATVVSQGQKHFVNGLGAGIHSFFERLPGKAGDVLGARFDTSPFIDSTPYVFATASASDETGYVSTPTDPEPGDSFTGSPIANRRVNVSAVFEPDEDGDGYGDTSQDLCPGGPLAVAACSGVLFGSRLQGSFTKVGFTCGYACLRVQKTLEGQPTAAPFDGVVVRWRMLGATAGDYRIRTLGPLGGTAFSVLGSSDVETVGAAPEFDEIVSFPTRLPIPAGGYVGLVPPPFAIQPFQSSAPGAMYQQVNDPGNGGSVNFAGYGTSAGELRYDADIEPDADHDGYGDVSQDACPADVSTQGACPPRPQVIVDDRPIRCGGKRATVVGSAGKDRLKGTNRADVIAALAGDDTIRALAGNDVVCAGKGRDTVLGGLGKDRLIGEGGVDTLRGGPGKDVLVGGPGKDLQQQ